MMRGSGARRPAARWKVCLFALGALLFPLLAWAQTAVIQVDFLPLDEAADVARGQLSANGSVALMPSRGVLIVNDDADHIRHIRALLQKLDMPAQQFIADVKIVGRKRHEEGDAAAAGEVRLDGGWVRIFVRHASAQSAGEHTYRLRLTSGRAAHIEAGEIAILPSTRAWLHRYGVAAAAVPLTGGFDIVARAAGEDQAHVRIRPWLRWLDAGGNGSASGEPQRIDVAGAATELMIPLDQDVTIAAVEGDASQMAHALFGRHAQAGGQWLEIHLRLRRL